MKATITRPDGTKIEAEGTAAEIIALLAPPVPAYVPVAPQTCTCWAGLCPLHTMRGLPLWPPYMIGEPWCVGSLTSDSLGWAHNNVAACVPNMGKVRIGAVG